MRTARNSPGVDDDATEGIYYVIWNGRKWEKGYDVPASTSHARYWKETIVPQLKKDFKLTKTQARDLHDVYRCMPRGRVSDNDGKFFISHGDDLPRGQKDTIDWVISVFGLTNRHLSGKVVIQYSDHETMLPEHKKAAQDILGKIPY